MKATLPNIRKLAGRGRTDKSAGSEDINNNEIESNEAAEPSHLLPCPCSSCCPTWKRTGQCAWTG